MKIGGTEPGSCQDADVLQHFLDLLCQCSEDWSKELISQDNLRLWCPISFEDPRTCLRRNRYGTEDDNWHNKKHASGKYASILHGKVVIDLCLADTPGLQFHHLLRLLQELDGPVDDPEVPCNCPQPFLKV